MRELYEAYDMFGIRYQTEITGIVVQLAHHGMLTLANPSFNFHQAKIH